MQDTHLILFIAFAAMAFVVLMSFVVFALLMRPWLRAFMHGTPVSLVQTVAMRLRGNPPNLLIESYIRLKRSGNSATIADVENVYIDNKNYISTSDDLANLVEEQTRQR